MMSPGAGKREVGYVCFGDWRGDWLEHSRVGKP